MAQRRGFGYPASLNWQTLEATVPSNPDAYAPPDAGTWAAIDPEAAGFDPAGLAAVADFHAANESAWPRSMYLPNGAYAGTHYIGDTPPHDTPIGPVRPRGGPAGMLLRGGRVAGRWGDIDRADMAFSIAKSFLGVLAGLAVERGLIRSLDDPMAVYALDDGFNSPHNAAITWRQMLQQTSEWEGTLWGKPDTVDRNRQVGPGVASGAKGEARPLQTPGTVWEYNDVRVNRLSLSLMQVFRRPLPAVLDEAIMAPIGATGWAWHGYANSTVEIDGQAMESVSGGGHWGGGFQIPTHALARFGLLIGRKGRWNGRKLIAESWIEAMLAPCPANPVYGFMWWLNTDRALHPSAPASSVFAKGAGSNLIWIDPDSDLVLVARWIEKDKVDGLIATVREAMVPA
jgi:CubicO group peptidase (beta-lactamase class C family)